jgi:hypothetical protein
MKISNFKAQISNEDHPCQIPNFIRLCHLIFGFHLTFACLPVGRDFDI